MNNKERLDKFKTLYKPKEEFTLLVAITQQDKFLGVVYRKVEIVSTRRGTKNIAETHIFYCKVVTIQEFLKELEPYIILQQTLQLV